MNRTLLLIGIGAGLVVVVVAAWAARRAAGAVGSAVNPLNPENIFYSGVGGVVSTIAEREETLGGWLAELFDPGTRAVREMLRSKPTTAP